MSEDYKKSNVACVQGYQWHVLNKSENWITRGVRSEYAGSYVIERSGGEILGALKQIAGSVYMVRRDLVEKFGWGTSITEDFELTLKLYEAGYKVVYTPYIQAPAECVSTIKRLIRQRMRWAEGHSHNVRKMFLRLMRSPNMNSMEKLETLYLSPYYLQASFFVVGTLSWLISETVFPARLPFWTSLWGWSLVLTNLLSLPLMNAVGLFLEESEEKDYLGLLSFVALSYILVPFQAYAAIKGLLEQEEGPWFRTPKTGKITDIFTRGRFYRLIAGILPGRVAPAMRMNSNKFGQFPLVGNSYLALATANNRFNSFSIRPRRIRWVSKATLAVFLIVIMLLNYLSFFTPQVLAQAQDPTIEQQINILDQQNSVAWYNASWTRRQPVTIKNNTPSALTNFQTKINVTYDTDMKAEYDDIRFTKSDGTTLLDHWKEFSLTESLLTSNPSASEIEVGVYGIVGNDLLWGNLYSVGAGTAGHIYKTDLTTKSSTTLYTGNRFAAWQGLLDGSTAYAVGEERDGGNIFRASLYKITTSTVTSALRSDTGDINELIGLDTDGTNIVAGERGAGGGTTGSSYPNGAGLWKIPISTATDPATWTREFEDSSGYEWVSVAYFNATWFGYLRDYSQGKWKVQKSTNLTSWTTELDYTSQTFDAGKKGMLIEAGSNLVALGAVQSTSTWHMQVYNGTSWTDYDLGISVSSGGTQLAGFWDSIVSRLLLFKTDSANMHVGYTVKLDNTQRTDLGGFSGQILHLQSNAAAFVKDSNNNLYIPVSRASSSTSEIRFDSLSPKQETFWVEVDSIPADSTATIYMYYGNSGASSASNGDNTFAFFDDFPGATLDSGKWSSSGTVTVADSIVSLDRTSTTDVNLWTPNAMSISEPFIVETKYRHATRYRNRTYLATSANGGSPLGFDYGIFSTSIYWNGFTGINLTANLSYIIRWINTTTDYAWNIVGIDESEAIERSKESAISGAKYLTFQGTENADSDFKLDWVRTRKFAASEPTVSLGTEETFSSYTSFTPTDNSLGIINFDPTKYNGETVYFEVVQSVNGTTWTRSRSSALTMPATAKNFTVRRRIGDNVSQTPGAELYNITDASSTSTITFGAATDIAVYLRAARLIIVQSDPTLISDTHTMVEVGNSETLISAADKALTDKKIYLWDSTKFSGTPNVYFEASLRAGWQNRRKITFDNSASTEDLNDFPVLIKLNSPNRIDYTKTQDAGQDIRFVDADGTTELSYEIEKWNESGDSFVWVKVPNIPAGSTTDYIWMYYNNTSASDGQNASSVWDSNYKGVWHFNETNASGNFHGIKDSTSNALNCIEKVSATGQTGQIDGGQQFDDVDDVIVSCGDPNVGNAITVEIWVNLTNVAAEIDRFISVTPEIAVLRHCGTGSGCSAGQLHFYIKTSGAIRSIQVNSSFTAATWYYVVGTWDGTNQRAYKNGSQVGSATPGGTLDSETSIQFSLSGEAMDGYLDEARISNLARSAEYIEAQNKSMTDTFVSSFGTEEAVGTGYVSLYTNGSSCSSQVTGSEVSVAGTTWTRSRSADIRANLSSGTEYMVCAENALVADAKIIVEQTDAGGLTAMEIIHEFVNTKKSLSQTGTTAYARLAVSGGAAVGGSTVSTTSTSYVRQRSASITPSTNTYDTEISLDNTTFTQQDFDNQYDSNSWQGGTFTYLFEATLRTPSANNMDIASSWLIIQVTNLQIPENLILFLPFALLLPALIRWVRARKPASAYVGTGFY